MLVRKVFLSSALVFIIVLTIFKQLRHQPLAGLPKTYDKQRSALVLHELNNPMDYLTSKAIIKVNQVMIIEYTFFGSTRYEDDGYLVDCIITNNASLAKYRDIVVCVTFYSS